MSKLNLPGVQASSGISGLLYVDIIKVSPLLGSITVNSPTGTSITQTVNLDYGSSEVLSIINFNTSGTGASSIDDYWWPLINFSSFNVFGEGYIFTVSVESAANGRNILVTFINNEASSNVNIPPITFNFTAYLYGYPF